MDLVPNLLDNCLFKFSEKFSFCDRMSDPNTAKSEIGPSFANPKVDLKKVSLDSGLDSMDNPHGKKSLTDMPDTSNTDRQTLSLEPDSLSLLDPSYGLAPSARFVTSQMS